MVSESTTIVQFLDEKIDAMITTKASSIVESDDAMFKAFSRKELIELLTF